MKIRKIPRLTSGFLLIVALLLVGGIYWYKSWQDRFAAPRQEGPSLEFRVIKNNTLMAVTGNLKYYGVVKDEDALLYALKRTKDDKPGNEGSIKVGSNDIDTDATYTISQTMSAWEIARILLNEGTPIIARGHGPEPTGGFSPELLPGGDLAPSLQEKLRVQYQWVNSYEDCVKAHGQLSSEQYAQRTGKPRECINPDGRVFTQGQEGWKDRPSP